MSTENRRRNVIGFEGQTMAFAGQYGLDVGLEHAQCVIDGAANALVRMDGAKNTAEFLYAVADRVCSGVREPTACPAALLPAPRAELLIKEIDEPLPRSLLPVRANSLGAIVAVSVAFWIALVVTLWR